MSAVSQTLPLRLPQDELLCILAALGAQVQGITPLPPGCDLVKWRSDTQPTNGTVIAQSAERRTRSGKTPVIAALSRNPVDVPCFSQECQPQEDPVSWHRMYRIGVRHDGHIKEEDFCAVSWHRMTGNGERGTLDAGRGNTPVIAASEPQSGGYTVLSLIAFMPSEPLFYGVGQSLPRA